MGKKKNLQLRGHEIGKGRQEKGVEWGKNTWGMNGCRKCSILGELSGDHKRDICIFTTHKAVYFDVCFLWVCYISIERMGSKKPRDPSRAPM